MRYQGRAGYRCNLGSTALAGALIALGACLVAACGPMPPAGSGGRPGAPDASTHNTPPPSTDAGARTSGPDGAVPVTPVGDAGSPGDPAGSQYGTCGQTTFECMCHCDADAGDTCANACIDANAACGSCLSDAYAACCPAEDHALSDCADMAGCTDESCLAAHCGSQIDAYNTCLDAQTDGTHPACSDAITGCTGTAECM